KKERETTISWQPPSRPNGIVTHYNIYQNSHLHATVPGARVKYIASFLQPYTIYQFQVEGCTSKGCSLSSESLPIQTLPDAPEDIPAPELYSDTPTSVLVSWQSPLHLNGLVESFTIERRIKGTEQEFYHHWLKVDSAFHPSEVSKMRTRIVGGNMLIL
uniref:Fibronectin type-III domain-containing protein n=1 Tax=Laticauda laticaudata TaxID=8630 RepID=A0A8C5SRS5_LATLA